jgi:hypothetical protein
MSELMYRQVTQINVTRLCVYYHRPRTKMAGLAPI